MKVAAHPLVVAVALGLLGPSALEELAPAKPATPSVLELTEADAPDAEQIARVAEAFQVARDQI